MKRLFPVANNEDFLKLWFAQIASQISLNALYFVLALKVYEQAASSNTAVSLLILAFTVPTLIFGYLAGIYVDHQDLKKILVYSNLLRALAVFLLLFAGGNLFVLYLVVVVLSMITLVFLPAEGAAIPSLVRDKKDLIAANSMFTLTIQSSIIIGFIFAGPALSLLGERLTIVLLGSLFLAAFVFVLGLPSTIRPTELAAQAKPVKSFLDGIVFFFKTATVRDAIVFLTSAQAIILVLATIGPGFVDKILNLDIRLTSLILVAPAALGMIIGSIALGNLGYKYSQVKLVNNGLLVAGTSFLALSFLERQALSPMVYFVAVIFIVLLGLSTALVSVPATTQLQSDTPENMRGRVYGILGTFGSGASAIPVIVAGAVGDVLGVQKVILGLGIFILVVALYRLFSKSYT